MSPENISSCDIIQMENILPAMSLDVLTVL
jgi:hypothetical protein